MTWAEVAQPAKQETNPVRTALQCFEAQDREKSRQREKEVIASLPPIARSWLTEDVTCIISPEERCAFLHLATDQERDQFIEQFWYRRAPAPESLDNSFKQEHYERIVFANEKYEGQVPGWRTDRGRVYVTFGPPDSIESHPSGEKTGRPLEDGSETVQYSWEAWHYRHLDGVGENIELKFVDPSGSGDYRLSIPPEMSEEVIFAPPYNVGYASSGDGATRSGQTVEIHVGPLPTPLVQFKDLEAMVVHQIARMQVQFNYQVKFARGTHATTLAEILVNISDNQQSSTNNGAQSLEECEVFGRVSKPSGRVVYTFERRIPFAGQISSGHSQSGARFQLALAPDTYRLAIVVKDLSSGDTGTLYTTFDVPPYERAGNPK